MNFRISALTASVVVFVLIWQVSVSSSKSLLGFSPDVPAEVGKFKISVSEVRQSVMAVLTHEQEVKFNQFQNRLRQIANRDT
ncbi:MAG: hypothetical protein O3C43_16130 [Verrucomicrobia bacterium]|nr:hypothetical protein [Verrucomicrobiota bacterium]MDA1068018.1 hypothetical protein [Verrucomicrobiota bacterium]